MRTNNHGIKTFMAACVLICRKSIQRFCRRISGIYFVKKLNRSRINHSAETSPPSRRRFGLAPPKAMRRRAGRGAVFRDDIRRAYLPFMILSSQFTMFVVMPNAHAKRFKNTVTMPESWNPKCCWSTH